jgi:superfamily I DNA/RNA helicase
MDYQELSDDEMVEARADALATILADDSPRKLVVAGPGTGKTHAFKELFGARDGSKLALTFLTSLVRDLDKELGAVADVYSFHGFAHLLLRTIAVTGVSKGVDYYPALELIYEHDVALLGTEATQAEIEKIIMNLRDESPVLANLLRCGGYYDAVGYSDSVYRVLRQLQAEPGAVPAYAQIVVDEYQDFSLMETEFIEALAQASPILVVGDDDQALYTFRHASAIYLRALVNDDRYTNFELPFCSRCTEVLVAATHHVAAQAQEQGLLTGRIPKAFVCYRPDKKEASERHRAIVHAQCSVENKNAPYMERYLEEAIREIPDEDIKRSREAGYPTALVIGPRQFSGRAFEYLSERFADVEYKMSEQLEVRALDGYKRLANDPESRLGWRILLYLLQPSGWSEVVTSALANGDELAQLVDDGFRQEHLGIATLVARLLAEEELTPGEVSRITDAAGLGLADLLAALGIETTEADPQEGADGEKPEFVADEPSILVTSLMGAKGLEASHVFVVGVNDGHFPRDNKAPTDDEVCQLLVALTRARESCTIVSTRNFGGSWLNNSIFTDWLKPFIGEMVIDKTHFAD